MKKITAMILSFVLIFTLTLSLTACSDKNSVVGSWKAEVDLTEMINEGIADDEDMAEYVALKDFSFAMTLKLKDDGTYEMSVDEDDIKDVIKSAKKDLQEGFNKYFEDLIDSQDLGVTVDELLDSYGLDLDALIEAVFSDEMVDEIVSEMSSEGKYKAEDGKLYFSDDLDSDIDEDEYTTYEMADNELKLMEAFGEDAAEMEDLGLFPMTFKKVG